VGQLVTIIRPDLDRYWRQSFLCGRALRVEQFASGSSSRGQITLF